MMKPTSWGDQAILHTVSILWQAKTTVVNVGNNTIWEYRLRHDQTLDKADLVLVYNCKNHYLAAGMSNRPVDRSFVQPVVFSSTYNTIPPFSVRNKSVRNPLLKCEPWKAHEGFTWESYGSDKDPDMDIEYREHYEVLFVTFVRSFY